MQLETDSGDTDKMLSLTIAAAAFAPAPQIPTVTIAPGVELPMAGLGTWQCKAGLHSNHPRARAGEGEKAG